MGNAKEFIISNNNINRVHIEGYNLCIKFLKFFHVLACFEYVKTEDILLTIKRIFRCVYFNISKKIIAFPYKILDTYSQSNL